MNVYILPTENAQERARLARVIQDLAEVVKADVTVKEQLCVRTSSTKLALILRQLACEDPDSTQDLTGRKPRGRRAQAVITTDGLVRPSEMTDSA